MNETAFTLIEFTCSFTLCVLLLTLGMGAVLFFVISLAAAVDTFIRGRK